ncbi:MAG: CbiQ family ECF transporter T component [Candidatus Methylomirabilales bacterium]
MRRAPAAPPAFAALIEARGLRPPADRFLTRGLRRLARFSATGPLRQPAAARPQPLRALQPRARLMAVLLYLVSLSLASSLPVLLAHGAIPAALLVLSRVRLREGLGGGLLLAAASALCMAAPATLNLVQPGEIVLPLAEIPAGTQLGPLALPARIGVTREGLLGAATLLARVVGSVAMVLWLTLATPWLGLLRALRGVGVPAVVVQVAGMAVRYLHVLLAHAEAWHLGKRSRTVCRRPLLAEQAGVGAQVGMAWARGLHLMDEVSAAMTARGFTGELPAPPGARLLARDWAFLLAIALGCLGTRLA